MQNATKIPILIAALIGCLHGKGQTAPALWQHMEQAFEDCGFDPVNAEIEARRILKAPEASLECDSLLIAEFLLRHSVNLLETSWPPANFDLPDDCNHAPSPLLFARGVTAFRQGEYATAEHWFRKSAEVGATENTVNHQQGMQALGATLTHLNRYQEALTAFQDAYDLAPENTNPIGLNNLAYACIVVGRCAEAVDWCNLALERVKSAVENDMPYAQYLENERNAILLTRMFAEMQQRDEAASAQTLSEMDLQGTWNGRELPAVSALTNHALWLNDPDRFAAIRSLLLKWIEEESSADVLEALGACHALFPPWSSEENWRMAWEQVREVPELFRGLPSAGCYGAQPVSGANRSMFSGVFAIWTLMLIAVLATWYFIVLWRMHRKLVALDGMTSQAWEERVEAALLGGGRLTSMKRLEALRAIQNLADQEWQLGQIRSAQIHHWPILEQNVARCLAAGEHTKSIAQRLDISVSTVYKTRHAIRSRLNLKASDSLRKRLQELLHVLLLSASFAGGAIANDDLHLHPKDKLIAAIHLDDSTRWREAIRELRQLENDALPPPFDAALLPMEQRPDWAQVPDSIWWVWFKSASASLELALTAEQPENLLHTSSDEASDALLEERFLLHPDRAMYLAVLLVLILGGMAGLAASMHRMKLRPEQSNWRAISAGVEDPQARPEAIAAWKVFKAKQSHSPVPEGLWTLLSSTEQEVANLLAQDWTVAQIAQHLSCSTGNVYNLRSSIRRKWSLEASDDLVRFILSIQTETD